MFEEYSKPSGFDAGDPIYAPLPRCRPMLVIAEPATATLNTSGSAITDQGQHHGNEIFIGSPESNPEGFEYSSNIRLAGNLKGKLLMIHGTHDTDVPLSHALRMAQALIEADKPFDLLILPGQGHGSEILEAGYVRDATIRYFIEHLGSPEPRD